MCTCVYIYTHTHVYVYERIAYMRLHGAWTDNRGRVYRTRGADITPRTESVRYRACTYARVRRASAESGKRAADSAREEREGKAGGEGRRRPQVRDTRQGISVTGPRESALGTTTATTTTTMYAYCADARVGREVGDGSRPFVRRCNNNSAYATGRQAVRFLRDV